jgi:Zn-dependent peptidase ImmA (M78 family)
LIASVTDQWLPTTDAKTVRQKIQRAFAAEFLCPIASLKYWLQGDYSLESIEDAGAYFDVSPLAIRSHLANHGLIHPAEVMP